MTAPRSAPTGTGAVHHGDAGARIPDLATVPVEVPSMARLREALRGPETPLPFPRSVREAAVRVRDLVHAERFAPALFIAERFRRDPAPHPERLELLRAQLAGSLAAHETYAEQGEMSPHDLLALQELVRDMVQCIEAAGAHEQAAATLEVLGAHLRGRVSERPPEDLLGSALASAAAGSRGRHRRRREDDAIPPGLLAVVRCLELPRPRETAAEERALHEALLALPELEVRLVEDPGPQLVVRYAQDLETSGRPQEAARMALDVLEEVSHLEAREGGFADAARAAVGAHAVLARTLVEEAPLAAVGHALAALEGLRDVEDPPLRVGLVTDLLGALVRCELQDQATFTAGRLASLARTLPREEQRIEPLLAVGAQRVAARRYDGAEVVLGEVQSLTSELGDRRSHLEATRLLARLHHEQGHGEAALEQLGRVAADARWVADDLITPAAERPRFVRAELDAQALVLRHALDIARPAQAAAAARAIIRRVRAEREMRTLPEALLWDHEADARIGAMIAEGIRLAGDADASRTPYEKAHREAVAAIERVPEGHEDRASYWGAYLDDRHAAMLAARGERSRALRAAQRAERAWRSLGREDEAARIAQEIGDGSPGVA